MNCEFCHQNTFEGHLYNCRKSDDTNLRVIGRLAERVEQLMEKQMSEGNTTVPVSDRSQPGPRSGFIRELQALINRTCQENGSNTPDFMLASYLTECLSTWDKHVNWREQWYGRKNDGPAKPELLP